MVLWPPRHSILLLLLIPNKRSYNLQSMLELSDMSLMAKGIFNAPFYEILDHHRIVFIIFIWSNSYSTVVKSMTGTVTAKFHKEHEKNMVFTHRFLTSVTLFVNIYRQSNWDMQMRKFGIAVFARISSQRARISWAHKPSALLVMKRKFP